VPPALRVRSRNAKINVISGATTSDAPGAAPRVLVEQIMGMPIILDVRDPHVDPSVLGHVFDWFREVDERFSTWKIASEISRLNRGDLDLSSVHADVREVLARCEELRIETGGYFDVRAEDRETIDPSGLVKGWSVDRAAGILDEAGARNYCVNAGGDMRTRGAPLPEPNWRIGIQHPRVRDMIATVVVAEGELAVATSGAYERGQHVFDPHTGRPPAGVLSVTITGPVLATADAYATAAFAMGRAGPDWTAGLPAYEAMTILDDDRVLKTQGFPAAPAES
jgi:thiamine biosynthesis lipoprotein